MQSRIYFIIFYWYIYKIRIMFFYYIKNSLFITLFSLLGIAFLVPLVSYAIARNMKKRYYRIIYILFISGAFVPFTILMVPQIKLMSNIHMLNSYGLILLYWCSFGVKAFLPIFV